MNRSESPHTWPRLFVNAPLSEGACVVLGTEQGHYLTHVLRGGAGEPVRLFNGRQGEWIARLGTLPVRKKESVTLLVETVHKEQPPARDDLILCCAPLRRAHFEFMVMKATELGVSHIQPVLTERTQHRTYNQARMESIAVEAAEQSERLDVPSLLAPLPLNRLIESWPHARLALVCAEFGQALPIAKALGDPMALAGGGAAVFTGPEGGYTQKEMDMMTSLPRCLPLRLGPHILRADTAAMAAISCYQALCGNWR